MSKQQDELREKIRDEFNGFSYSVLGDYDDMPKRVDAIEKIINSSVQAVLLRSTDGVRRLQTYKMAEGAEDVMVIRDEAVSVIEEVRKDYE